MNFYYYNFFRNKISGVIIDAGHGGIDSGATGYNLQEKDLTLRAAKYMYKRLQELGIPAKMTRTDDEYLPKQERIKKVLELYNNDPNVLLISNHINAGGAEGAEVVYSIKNNPTFANMILNNIGKKGQLKRKIYQRRLPENPNKDYYYILRESGKAEPVLIEYGFIDNKNDSSKLNRNIEEYVEGVVEAIAEYGGYPYTRPGINNDYYVVQPNDTLYSIAKKYKLNVEELKKLNNLKSDLVYPGQKLFVTKESIYPLEIYVVKEGDTLYSIAEKYNTTINKIKIMNDLINENIYPGQKLILETEKKEEIIIPSTPNNQNGKEYDIYVVTKNDSLWKISRKYNISVEKLKEINNLNDINLQIGDKLLVPKKENQIYIVKKGDSLWTIAKKYNITVNELKKENDKINNVITIGEQLKIPNIKRAN